MRDKLNLDSKVAIITGAARGRGREIAQVIVEYGGSVVICDVLDEEGQATAHDLGGAVWNDGEVEPLLPVVSLLHEFFRRFLTRVVAHRKGGGVRQHARIIELLRRKKLHAAEDLLRTHLSTFLSGDASSH